MTEGPTGAPAAGGPVGRPGPDEYAPFYAGYIDAVPGGHLLDVLRQRGGLAALARDLDPALADYAYASSKWTVAEAVQHVIDTERIFQARVLRIARGDTTPLPGFDQDPYVAAATPRPLAALADEFDRLRTSTVDLVGSLSPTDLLRTGTASGAPLSARAAAWIVVGHERHHTAGAARAVPDGVTTRPLTSLLAPVPGPTTPRTTRRRRPTRGSAFRTLDRPRRNLRSN